MNKQLSVVSKACWNIEEAKKLITINPQNIYEVFAECFIDRFLNGFKVLRFELKYRNKHKYLNQSIAKNIRSSILDFLIIRYISMDLEKYYNDPSKRTEKFVENMDKLLCDHLNNQLKYLAKAQSKGWIDKDERNRAIQFLIDNFAFGFNVENISFGDPQKSLKTKEFLGAASMFDLVERNDDNLDFATAYELYNHFSKYDHFGTFSPRLNHEIIKGHYLNPGIHFMLGGCILALQLVKHPNERNPYFNNLNMMEQNFSKLKL